MENKMDSMSWHLDKKVPVSIIITIVIQLVVGVIWASKLDSRVDALERDQLKQDKLIKDTLVMMREDMRDLSVKVDRIIENDIIRRQFEQREHYEGRPPK